MQKEITKKKKIDSILITGGGGYIGSHTIISLLNNGYNIVAIDNFIKHGNYIVKCNLQRANETYF